MGISPDGSTGQPVFVPFSGHPAADWFRDPWGVEALDKAAERKRMMDMAGIPVDAETPDEDAVAAAA